MIKSISSTGRYFHTSGGGGTNYINNYSGAQGLGNMRFNATVGLDAEAIELLDWAKAKKQEEHRLKALAKQHPGIQDLQQKLEIMVALVNQDSVA